MTKALAASLLAVLLLAGSSPARVIKEGGTFRLAFAVGRVNAVDPALPDIPIAQRLLAPACGTLMAYPNQPPPAGYRLAPSLAEAAPVVSRDARMYTLTIRKDARFSDGSPVTARAFVRALERIFTPAMESPWSASFADILGARKMLAGKTTTLDGAVAKGRTLTLRLTKPIPDLLNSLTKLCAVPPNLPADPEGAKAPLQSPAPYYVAEYVPGERLVMSRNRFYRGERPHHVVQIVADLTYDFGKGIDAVANGAIDTFWPAPTPEQIPALVRRYGVDKSQFFVAPGTTLRTFVINTDRPLFQNNPMLRRALNFAVDRKALTQEAGRLLETPTDQYLLPAEPGYRDVDIYPLKGPDLKRARAIAKGHTRRGKAVLYTIENQPSETARAQILQRNLKAIGIELKIKEFPFSLYFDKISTPGEPFDFLRLQFTDLTDPVSLNEMLSGYSSKYDRLLARIARLVGDARYRAYGDLDVEISRDLAPMIPVSVVNWPTFVSARVGCVVLNPNLDLTAVCLK